jgi:hypothetical protein
MAQTALAKQVIKLSSMEVTIVWDSHLQDRLILKVGIASQWDLSK